MGARRLRLFNFPQPRESFDVVVIGVDDGSVDFRTRRPMPSGVEQEGGSRLSAAIGVGAEVGKHPLSQLQVARAMPVAEVGGHLEECRCHDAGG